MNADINTTAHLPRMVELIRNRRSTEEVRMEAMNMGPETRGLVKCHERQWEMETQAMNEVTIAAMRAGAPFESLSWLVWQASDEQLEDLYCGRINDADMLQTIDRMRTA